MASLSTVPPLSEQGAQRAAGTPEDPVLAAGVVLWTGAPHAPHFLMLRNAKHQSWGLPKGHAEPGEDLVVTALREVKEETGYHLEGIGGLRDNFADTSLYEPKPGVWKRVVIFLATTPLDPDEFQRSAEHDDHAWLRPDEAVARCDHDALRRTLRLAQDRLGLLATR